MARKSKKSDQPEVVDQIEVEDPLLDENEGDNDVDNMDEDPDLDEEAKVTEPSNDQAPDVPSPEPQTETVPIVQRELTLVEINRISRESARKSLEHKLSRMSEKERILFDAHEQAKRIIRAANIRADAIIRAAQMGNKPAAASQVPQV